ncbi:30S ribosomal protein S16 [Microvirga sp. STR05]|uniref:Small ribosomal subunit protein bS16 n=1 Tax=Hymenobacter duratus TaxID=2771356 RepID=A0ABR8JF69_9BACT|nr:30S ribosomal protein S16 [Hymenobacter duratus]MBD2714702.1 30S ribosomal protein S16 [Hymenobacter duratus]MBR7949606.1 30S ribosomal protein S16 [Microvirga sp. STR05]
MAVKIRLARRGRKKAAQFDIVVADSRAPRDGRFIEKIGTYDPNTNPASINFDGEKAFAWIMKGAEPTDTVRAMLSYRGVLYRKHLQLGVIKGAISQETADERFTSWKEQKDAKIEGKRTNIGTAKDEARKAALAAESKVKEARAEAIRKKNTPAPTEAPAAEGETTDAEATAETTEEAGA